MGKLLYKSLISCTLIFPLLLMTSCSGSGDVSEAKVVNINCNYSYSSAQVQLIKGLGLLEKYFPEDVTVVWRDVENGPDTRDALVAGSLDIAYFGANTFISAIDNNLPLVVLSYSACAPINVYSKRSDINTLSDLSPSNKIAITNRSTNLHIVFMAKCEQVFGDPMALDEALTPIPIADTIASLHSSDDFDGAVINYPNTIKVMEIDSMKLVSDMSDVISEYGIGSLAVASESFFDKNPKLIEAYSKAQKEAVAFATENPEEAARILSEFYQIDPSYVLETMKSNPITNVIRGYDKQANLLYEAGILQNKPKLLSELKNYENLEVAD